MVRIHDNGRVCAAWSVPWPAYFLGAPFRGHHGVRLEAYPFLPYSTNHVGG